GRVATAYFFENAPSLSRKTGAARLLPARKRSTAARSSWKSTVITRAWPAQRPASALTRSTTSRERGDQLAQMTAIVGPRARSASASCSPWRPLRWSPCAASGGAAVAITARRQAARAIGACRERMAVTGDLREGRSARLIEPVAVAVGHVEED